MSFWAQALLRKPARGGRAGRNEVASRFKCVTDGDWSRLINYWEKDLSKLEEKQVIKKNSPLSKDEANDYMKLSRVVIRLIEASQLSKAMGRVNSFGLGDIANPNVKAQLTEKFPPRKRPLPHSVSKLKPIDGFRELRQSLLSLNSGTAPGSGGLHYGFLTALGERMTSEEL